MSKAREVYTSRGIRNLGVRFRRFRREYDRIGAELSRLQEGIDDLSVSQLPSPEGKRSRDEVIVSPDVIAFRESLWAEYQLLKAGEYIAQGQDPAKIGDQKEPFARSIRKDPRVVYRWYRGALNVPARSSRSRDIERELHAAISRMIEAGVRPVVSPD